MSKHVVFFGIDGAQLSKILALHSAGQLPQLDRFFVQEAYTGGNLNTPTQQATSSGPGWSTLLTGTWVDKHGVSTNNSAQVKPEASSLFERIDAAIPGADIRSHVTWSDINAGHFKQEVATTVDGANTGGTDADNLQLTLDAIAEGKADFIFNHYDEVDHVGHPNGFGELYDKALIDAFNALISVLDAIEAREAAHPDEDWLLLAATDHGRTSNGRDHGGQSAGERQSFILSNEPISTGTAPVPVTSVATTILDFLNIGFNMNELVSQSILNDGDPNDGTGQPATAVETIWSENFESLAGSLGAYTSATESGGDGTDWTAAAPTGWTLNDGATPAGGPAEFRGWTFHDKNSWIATAGDQLRSQFGQGEGVVAVADADEYDDGTNIDPGNFNVFMQTKEIDISGYATDSLEVSFDSSFRPDGQQTGTLEVSYDGGLTFTEILRLDSAVLTDTAQLRNQTISIDLDAGAADSVMFRWGMVEAGNNWWWAIDNIALTGERPLPQLLFSENFESLSSGLGAYTSATESGGDGTDWTATAPTGWTLDDGATPVGGPAEFRGWTFHDKNSWIATAGDQSRSAFTRGQGVVAVADPDEYDDGTNIDPANFNVFMRTKEIDLGLMKGDTFRFVFDSSFRAEGTQAGEVRASFDGGATFTEVFELDSTVITDSTPHLNEQVSLDLDANGADSVIFEFGMKNAGNNWWWAIDNIGVWG